MFALFCSILIHHDYLSISQKIVYRVAEKCIPDVTYFVYGGTLNLNLINHSIVIQSLTQKSVSSVCSTNCLILTEIC